MLSRVTVLSRSLAVMMVMLGCGSASTTPGTQGNGGAGASGGGGPGGGGVAGNGGGGVNGGSVPTGLLVGSFSMSGATDGVGESARLLNYITELHRDEDGDLYIYETASFVRKIVVATKTVSSFPLLAQTFISTSEYGSLGGFTPGKPGDFYVIAGAATTGATFGQAIYKVDLAMGTVVAKVAGGLGDSTDGVGTAAGLRTASRLEFDGDDTIYFIEPTKIRKATISTGAVTTVAGSATAGSADGVGPDATFTNLYEVTLDRNGHAFVLDSTLVRQLDLSTGMVTTLAGQQGASLVDKDGIGAAASFYFPGGMAADGEGTLYIGEATSSAGPTIRKIDVTTGTVSTVKTDLFGGSAVNGQPGTVRLIWVGGGKIAVASAGQGVSTGTDGFGVVEVFAL